MSIHPHLKKIKTKTKTKKEEFFLVFFQVNLIAKAAYEDLFSPTFLSDAV